MGPPPTLCTHLAGALATSARGRSLCIHDVCTRNTWGHARGGIVGGPSGAVSGIRRGERPLDPPGGRRNTSKSNSPDVQADARHTLLFPLPRDTRMSRPLTTFGATSVADAFTTGDLGKEKDSTRHLSSSAFGKDVFPRERKKRK